MRKTVNVCGVNHMSGISKKTDKPYDFTEIHFTYQDDHVEGLNADHAKVNQSMIGDRHILVGEDLDMVFHFYQNRVVVDAIL